MKDKSPALAGGNWTVWAAWTDQGDLQAGTGHRVDQRHGTFQVADTQQMLDIEQHTAGSFGHADPPPAAAGAEA